MARKKDRNIIHAAFGEGPDADEVIARFIKLGRERFRMTKSAFIRALVMEIVAAMDTLSLDDAKRLGLVEEILIGPEVCRKVVAAYEANSPRIKKEYDELISKKK